MRRVIIVQSFDGHPLGAVVGLSDSAAESAMIQRRAALIPEEGSTVRLILTEPFEGNPADSSIELDLGVASVLILRGIAIAAPAVEPSEPVDPTVSDGLYGHLKRRELTAIAKERGIKFLAIGATNAKIVALLESADAKVDD
ncbi:MAG: hypothetical protein IH945_09470 [Armatimonadetes bacterium]|nr:hypothetical protein [Armatimonadota bacterium]